MESIIFCWSGGKDSSLALNRILQNEHYEVSVLLTTINAYNERVSMHGLRKKLVDQQAASLELPIKYVCIPEQSSNEVYESKMKEVLVQLKEKRGIKTIAFGDIFLEGIRVYREKLVNKASMEAIFPLWQEDTEQLAQTFIKQGFKAITLCVDNNQLSSDFIARPYDKTFLFDLPDGVDPCGENGEFHTFVYDGPDLKEPVPFEKGEQVTKEYSDLYNSSFTFFDLKPAG